MVKKIAILSLMLSTLLMANEFDKNCLVCHGDDFKFSIIMQKYTLKYSSKQRIKKAIFEYLREPNLHKSILPYEYIKRFGIKEKSTLSDSELNSMIDIYYEKYNIQAKIY
ncbi:MAG: hypothetical protein WC144_01295 [Sulfurimonas sp.]|nr:hypothetical protein [Sulfurimonadaceae bacterium]